MGKDCDEVTVVVNSPLYRRIYTLQTQGNTNIFVGMILKRFYREIVRSGNRGGKEQWNASGYYYKEVG
jgi:hypothetical protein